jgi:hypothetical protein
LRAELNATKAALAEALLAWEFVLNNPDALTDGHERIAELRREHCIAGEEGREK